MKFFSCSKNKVNTIKLPIGSKFVLLLAHPDDESFGFGGLIQRKKKFGVDLITLTRGDAGQDSTVHKTSNKTLAEKRVKELKKASRALNIRNLFVFDFPDGRLSDFRNSIKTLIQHLADSSYESIITMHFLSTSRADHKIIGKLLSQGKKRLNKKVFFGFRPEKISTKSKMNNILLIKMTKKELETKKKAILCHKTQQADIDRILPNLYHTESYLTV